MEKRKEKRRNEDMHCGLVWFLWHIVGQCKADGTATYNMTHALPLGTAVTREVDALSPCTLLSALLLLGCCGFMSIHPHGMEDLLASAGSQS